MRDNYCMTTTITKASPISLCSSDDNNLVNQRNQYNMGRCGTVDEEKLHLQNSQGVLNELSTLNF